MELNIIDDYSLFSWNVNSYMDNRHIWLLNYITKNKPDVIFLSETKKNETHLKQLFDQFTDYNYVINTHNPTHWHGVAMLINKRHTFQRLDITLDINVRSDNKSNDPCLGRVIGILINNKINIIGTYIPNSGNNDNVKYNYRTNIWDKAFYDLLSSFSQKQTVWLGDINVALTEDDVSNVRIMCKYAGFTLKERENFYRFLVNNNWIDVWRYRNHYDKIYTWHGTKNPLEYGMRLDNILVTSNIIKGIKNASFIVTNISDHIPVCATITC